MDTLIQSNEGLMIQNESLERDVWDRDKLNTDARVEVDATQCDRD